MTVPASLFLNMFSSDALLLGLQDCVQVISWPGKRGGPVSVEPLRPTPGSGVSGVCAIRSLH